MITLSQSQIQKANELLDYFIRNGSPKGASLQSHKHFKNELLELMVFIPDKLGRTTACIYALLNNITSEVVCECCGKPHYSYDRQGKPRNVCGIKCSNKLNASKTIRDDVYREKMSNRCKLAHSLISDDDKKATVAKRKATSLMRYGTEHPMQCDAVAQKQKDSLYANYGVHSPLHSPVIFDKVKSTNLVRYGSEFSCMSPSVILKKNATNIQRYGNECSLMNDAVSQKAKDTLFNNHGVTHPSHMVDFKEKCAITSANRYGTHHPMSHPDIRKKFTDSVISRNAEFHEFMNNAEQFYELYNFGGVSAIIERFNVSEFPIYKYAKLYGYTLNKKGTSFKEDSVFRYIRGLLPDVDITQSDRSILGTKEIDIYIPSMNIAIEFNGIYWHSELFKDEKYHQEKAIMCKEQGIKLLTIWEDDWDDVNKREIIKRKIAHIVGKPTGRVYARQCTIISVKNSDIHEFMTKNHIQGTINSTVNYALVYMGEIVAVMGFKRINDSIWDLTRFATSVSVVGGASKLLSHFETIHSPTQIHTFASLDYSIGSLYDKLGFLFVKITQPNYWYIINKVRENRHKFMKHKLNRFLPQYDESLSERDNMWNNGYCRIYDCGSIKYIKYINNADVI